PAPPYAPSTSRRSGADATAGRTGADRRARAGARWTSRPRGRRASHRVQRRVELHGGPRGRRNSRVPGLRAAPRGGRVMDYQQILYAVDAGILTITLNRPERLNAFTARMMHELLDAFARADADDAVRAV